MPSDSQHQRQHDDFLDVLQSGKRVNLTASGPSISLRDVTARQAHLLGGEVGLAEKLHGLAHQRRVGQEEGLGPEARANDGAGGLP